MIIAKRLRVRLAKQLEAADRLKGIVVDDLGAAVDSTDCNAIAHSVGKLFRGKGGEGHFRRVLVGSHSDVVITIKLAPCLTVGGGRLPLVTGEASVVDAMYM